MWAAALATTAMMLHVVADVAGRVLFHAPISGTAEITQAYYMVALTFLPMAYVARTEGHIVVELFTRFLSPRKLRRLELFTAALTVIYCGVFAWMSGVSAWAETLKGERWQSAQGFTVVWPSRWLLPIGMGVLALYVAFWIIRSLRGDEPK